MPPVVVIDVRDWEPWPPEGWLEALREWAEQHGIKARDTYRIEVHVIDTLCARVFQYDRDEKGYGYCPRDHDHQLDADGCRVARREPYTVLLKSMPPEGP